jgi:hypothetical protein
MKLQRKILSFLRSRAIAYAAVRDYNKEGTCNRLYDRFDKLCRCSDQALYEEIAKKEDQFRHILPSPQSRYQIMRNDWLRLLDYARMQTPQKATI